MEIFKKTKGKVVENDESTLVQYISVKDIQPNPNQPRKIFKEEDLASLAQSISEVGLLQPITVRRAGFHWELIAGERRLRACQVAGLEHIPAIIMEVNMEQSSTLALVENIQRQNLDFMEEAQAIGNIITKYGLSQEEVSRQLGKSQSAVANMLRLLRLSPRVVETLRLGNCTQRHARALLKLQNEDLQLKVLEKVLEKKLNVSQTEELIAQILTPPLPKGQAPKLILRDVRLFLNTVNKSLDIMRTAGVDAVCEKQEDEEGILLKIRIPRKMPAGV